MRRSQAACDGYRKARQDYDAARTALLGNEPQRLEQAEAKIAACR